MFWKKEKSVRFIATSELGRLCKWLRILGYDCIYFEGSEKRELVITSLRENRIILTREVGMSRFSGTRMIHIENDFVEDQVRQVLNQMRLKVDQDKLFTRCTICNNSIQNVKKEDVRDRVPPYIYKTQDSFKECPRCTKVYWKGTHWKLANNFLKARAES